MRWPLLFASIVSMAIASTQSAGAFQSREQIRHCSSAAECVPSWSATLIVYALDSEGAPIADVRLTATSGLADETRTHRVAASTDTFGMAAISVVPDVPYTVDVQVSGFVGASVKQFSAEKGSLQSMVVTLQIDPAASYGVLRVPTATGK